MIKEGDIFKTQDGSVVDWIEEDSFFFKLSLWEKELLNFYDLNPDFIKPLSRMNEVKSFVKSGLKDLSVSRTSFNWGIKVPNSDHIMYVWIDALPIISLQLVIQNQFKKNKILGKLHPYNW